MLWSCGRRGADGHGGSACDGSGDRYKVLMVMVGLLMMWPGDRYEVLMVIVGLLVMWSGDRGGADGHGGSACDGPGGRNSGCDNDDDQQQ